MLVPQPTLPSGDPNAANSLDENNLLQLLAVFVGIPGALIGLFQLFLHIRSKCIMTPVSANLEPSTRSNLQLLGLESVRVIPTPRSAHSTASTRNVSAPSVISTVNGTQAQPVTPRVEFDHARVSQSTRSQDLERVQSASIGGHHMVPRPAPGTAAPKAPRPERSTDSQSPATSANSTLRADARQTMTPISASTSDVLRRSSV